MLSDKIDEYDLIIIMINVCQGYPNIIIASTEINKIPTIISNLKHIHKVNVLMRQVKKSINLGV